MSYVTLDQIEADIPADFLTQALDDDGDGDVTAIFATVQERVTTEIHSYLSQRFETPFADPIPPLVSEAAYVFTADALYRRRGFRGDDNPFAEQKEKLCKMLAAIGAGERPLMAGKRQAAPSVKTITEPARTTSRNNHLSS